MYAYIEIQSDTPLIKCDDLARLPVVDDPSGDVGLQPFSRGESPVDIVRKVGIQNLPMTIEISIAFGSRRWAQCLLVRERKKSPESLAIKLLTSSRLQYFR